MSDPEIINSSFSCRSEKMIDQSHMIFWSAWSLRLGIKSALKASQVYPGGYGKAICKHHVQWRDPWPGASIQDCMVYMMTDQWSIYFIKLDRLIEITLIKFWTIPGTAGLDLELVKSCRVPSPRNRQEASMLCVVHFIHLGVVYMMNCCKRFPRQQWFKGTGNYVWGVCVCVCVLLAS